MVNITDWQQSKADAEQDDSVQITNGAVAPGAGATIATVNVVKAGIYEITAIAGYGSTADVVDNMDLAVNGVQLLVLPVHAAANADRIPVTIRDRVGAGQAIAVRAVAAGAVSTVYRATIVATRVSG